MNATVIVSPGCDAAIPNWLRVGPGGYWWRPQCPRLSAVRWILCVREFPSAWEMESEGGGMNWVTRDWWIEETTWAGDGGLFMPELLGRLVLGGIRL